MREFSTRKESSPWPIVLLSKKAIPKSAVAFLSECRPARYRYRRQVQH